MNADSIGAGQERAISIYVHVPFCSRKCRYCNFFSVQGETHHFDPFLEALRTEWRLVREEENLSSPDLRIETVYVGGGTPSILGGARLKELLAVLRDGPQWTDDCEISVELNPEDTSEGLAAELLAAGYARLSVGVQSFDDAERAMLGRTGGGDRARRSVQQVRAAGCRNLSLDVIYGLPRQSVESWMRTLREALAFEPEHLSCYLLTLEEETVLHQLLHGGELETPLDEVLLQQYMATREAAVGAGYEHYEISNFARAGYRCRHNEGTWQRVPYFGLGPAAHSFDGRRRWGTAPDLEGYLKRLLQDLRRPAHEHYRLGPKDVAKEMILLGLRRATGLAWSALEDVTTPGAFNRLRRRARFLAGTGFLEVDSETLRLSPKAYFVSNSVFVELIQALEEDA
jgi:oxygen-independent coproporphyrinogen-3 oxidase